MKLQCSSLVAFSPIWIKIGIRCSHPSKSYNVYSTCTSQIKQAFLDKSSTFLKIFSTHLTHFHMNLPNTSSSLYLKCLQNLNLATLIPILSHLEISTEACMQYPILRGVTLGVFFIFFIIKFYHPHLLIIPLQWNLNNKFKILDHKVQRK